jgi:glyoxylase I family protein
MSDMQYSVEHIGLPARDPEGLKNWYIQKLGAVVAFSSPTQPPAFLVRLPGGVMLEISPADSYGNDPSDNTVAGFRHLALNVEKIETARDELIQRGVPFNEPIKPAAGGGRVLYFQDGEGNLLHLVDRPAGTLPR